MSKGTCTCAYCRGERLLVQALQRLGHTQDEANAMFPVPMGAGCTLRAMADAAQVRRLAVADSARKSGQDGGLGTARAVIAKASAAAR